jgi:hypothetical protein
MAFPGSGFLAGSAQEEEEDRSALAAEQGRAQAPGLCQPQLNTCRAYVCRIKCRWTGLATLQLDGLMSTDAAGDALNGLKDLVSLRHLTLSGSDVTPHLIEVSDQRHFSKLLMVL